MSTDAVDTVDQRVITCGLCFDILHNPITFVCKHSYCMNCVHAKMESQHGNGFACPLCNLLHPDVTARNLSDYADAPLARHVESMADGADEKRVCQWCEDAPAAAQCNECMCVYCGECCAAVHKSAARRGHMTGPIGDPHALRAMPRRCNVRGHGEYRAEFFCAACAEVCCAYCLQVGPHRQHESVPVARAAAEARQRIARDLHAMAARTAKMERAAADLNRVTAQYFLSYDHVESLVTARFDHFRQQLMQRELELRQTLATLREAGDRSLTAARRHVLLRRNALHEAARRCRRLQHGGADHEVLDGRRALDDALDDVPVVSGGGFRAEDLGDLSIGGMRVDLDLRADPHPVGAADGKGRALAAAPDTPLRLSFPVDADVEAVMRVDGVHLRCVAGGGGGHAQIGVRSKETMEAVGKMFPEDGGFVAWRVRLEAVAESFIGIVEKAESSSAIPDGFYWRPMEGVVDGRIGRFSPLASQLGKCRNGDIVRFVFDVQNGTLRVFVNDVDHGIVITDMHSQIAACFIFYPGEALTVLF